MAWIQWGDSPEVALAMLKDHVQDHENLLKGNADENIVGIVPTVNTLVTQLRFSKDLGKLLNALAVLLLALLLWRTETKPTVYIQPPPPQTQNHQKTDAEPAPSITSNRQPTQDAKE